MGTLEISLLVIAAVFMALKQGLADVPAIGNRVDFLRPRGWWSYIPIALVGGAGLVWATGWAFEAGYNAQLSRPESPLSLPGDYGIPTQPNLIDGAANILPSSVSKRYVDLMAAEHTDLQEQEFLRQYVGKNIALKLKLVSATVSRDDVLVQFGAGRNATVFARFDRSFAIHIAEIKPKTEVTFVATVVDLGQGEYGLGDARLVNTN